MSGPDELDGTDEANDIRRSFGELRMAALGESPADVKGLDEHGGLVQDGRVLDVLSTLQEAYDPAEYLDDETARQMPRNIADTDVWESVMAVAANRAASRAVSTGDIRTAEFLTGSQDWSSDQSGMHTRSRLERWLCETEQTRVVYIAAPMGRGKTSLAVSFLQVVWRNYQRARESMKEMVDADDLPPGVSFDDVLPPEPEFCANFDVDAPDASDAAVAEVHNYDDLLAEQGPGSGWIPADASSDDERWLIIDEASTELTAQSGENAQKVAEIFAPFVKKMRKKGVNLIVIGHDGGDVHVAIRSIADFVDKASTKSAAVYRSIKNRDGQGHLFDLNRIPDATWAYDTDDVAEWSWGSAEGEDGDVLDDETRRELRDQNIRRIYASIEEVTQSDLADAYDLRQATISTIINSGPEPTAGTEVAAGD
jgi:hypothetical protein